MSDLMRVYLDPAEIGADGYPYVWHSSPDPHDSPIRRRPIKDLVRRLAGNRCVRCGHPYIAGNPENSPKGEWSPCDEHCTHGGPTRERTETQDYPPSESFPLTGSQVVWIRRDAQWRILTVHHLNGIKHDCRWWNLAALCQRCHLTIQGRVIMERPYNRPHSEWFRPYVAGYYASLLGEDITREEAVARMDELLAPHELQRVLEGL